MQLKNRLSTIPLPLIVFLCARLPLLLALPIDGLRGYGDLLHFFNLASIPGLPYLNYWIEFPPAFAFLNELLYAVAGGVEHTYTYLFILVLMVADIGNILLFNRLEKIVDPQSSQASWRSLVYAGLLAGLPYVWWYFDTLAVFFVLLAFYLALSNRKAVWAGLVVGAGILVKIFPVLILPAILRTQRPRQAGIIALTAALAAMLPILILYLLSPTFTHATLLAQSSRGSWETIWALIDQKFDTGNLGPLVQRLDPASANAPAAQSTVLRQYALLLLFGGLGLFLWIRCRLDTPLKTVSFTGLTMVIFFIWSPAWSPQWIQYLLPLALLVLPFSPGLLLIAAMVLVNLLEWPLLLSRGLFYTLPFTVLLRLALMILLGLFFYRGARHQPSLAPTNS